MTSQKHASAPPNPRLVAEIEDALFEADDEALLAAPGMRVVADDARTVLV